MTIFSLSLPFAPIACRFVICAKPNFPSSHPLLPVILVCLSRLCSHVDCPCTDLIQGCETTVLHNLPTCFLQQPNIAQSNSFRKWTVLHGITLQITNLIDVPMKLFDQDLDLSCQFEQPARLMNLRFFMDNRSCYCSPLCFSCDLIMIRLHFVLIVRYWPLMQLDFSILVTEFRESLHITLMSCIDPLSVVLWQNVFHNSVCEKLLCLWVKITTIQIDLLHTRNYCYRLFIFRRRQHNGHNNVCRYVAFSHRSISQSGNLEIGFTSTTSILFQGSACTLRRLCSNCYVVYPFSHVDDRSRSQRKVRRNIETCQKHDIYSMQSIRK